MTVDRLVVVFFAVVGISNKCAYSGFFWKNSRKPSAKKTQKNLRLINLFIYGFGLFWFHNHAWAYPL